MTRDHGRLAIHAILGAAKYAFAENAAFHPPLKPLLQIHLPLGKLKLQQFRALLMSHFDTDLIRNRDEHGRLPVHIFCRNNAPEEVLTVLFEIDATVLHIAGHAGTLPLHECCGGMVDDSRARLLVELGGVGTLAARNHKGAMPLHVLCGSTNPSLRTVQYMIQSYPGSATATTNAGGYPFAIAACGASLSVVYELVRVNPDLLYPIY